MDRTVPYDEHQKCDECGNLGSWDFMGDSICPECLGKIKAAKALKQAIESKDNG